MERTIKIALSAPACSAALLNHLPVMVIPAALGGGWIYF